MAFLPTLPALAQLVSDEVPTSKIPSMLIDAEDGTEASALEVPEGAEELARFGAWAVFRYPRDPWRKCYVGSLAQADWRGKRLLVDAGGSELDFIAQEGHRGAFFEVQIGSRKFKFSLLLQRWHLDEGADSESDEDMPEPGTQHHAKDDDFVPADTKAWNLIEVMQATEKEQPGAMVERLPLAGFGAAYAAADGELCGDPSSIAPPAQVVLYPNELAHKSPGQAAFREGRWPMVGAFFERGKSEELLLRAIPLGDNPLEAGVAPAYSLQDARLEYYRNRKLIGWDQFGYFTKLKQVCASPDTGRLELMFTGNGGGSAGVDEGYSVFYDPASGEMMSSRHGSYAEGEASEYFGRWASFAADVLDPRQTVDEPLEVENVRVDVPRCHSSQRDDAGGQAIREWRSSVEAFTKRIMREEFFSDYVDWPRETEADQVELLRSKINGYLGDSWSWLSWPRHAVTDGFHDEEFSVLLRLIREGGPDYPLRYKRNDGYGFSVVNMLYRVGSGDLSPSMQMVFLRESEEDVWGPIYHAGPENILGRDGPAHVLGFGDGGTLSIGICVDQCHVTQRSESEYKHLEVELQYYKDGDWD